MGVKPSGEIDCLSALRGPQLSEPKIRRRILNPSCVTGGAGFHSDLNRERWEQTISY